MRSRSSIWRTVGLLSTAAILVTLAWLGGRWAGRSLGAEAPPASPTAAVRSRPHTPESVNMAALLERTRAQPGGLARRLALMKLADEADLGDLPALLSSGALSGEEMFHHVRRWAARDPAGCWAWYEREGAAAMGWLSPTNLIFAQWARQDPVAAMAALRATRRERRTSAADGLLEAWVLDEGKTAAALAPYLDELAPLSNAPTYWVTKQHPERMGARLLALPPGTARTEFIRKFGAGFFEKNWSAAVAWSASIPEPDRSALLAQSAATALNTKSEVRFFGNAGPPTPNPERLAWAQQWMTLEADPAMRSRLGPLYVDSLAASDPAAALDWANSNLGGLTLSRAIGKIIETQAATDREAALDLIDSLPPGGVRTKATDAFVAQWHDKEAGAAGAWALTQSRDALSDQGWGNLGSQWAFADPDSLKSAIQSHGGEVPPRLINGAIHNLVRKDAAGTAVWAAALPPTLREFTLSTTLRSWAGEDARAAAQFITANPAIPIPESATARIAERLHSRDPQAAVVWTSTLPAGPTRDTARAALKTVVEKMGNSAARDRLLKDLE